MVTWPHRSRHFLALGGIDTAHNLTLRKHITCTMWQGIAKPSQKRGKIENRRDAVLRKTMKPFRLGFALPYGQHSHLSIFPRESKAEWSEPSPDKSKVLRYFFEVCSHFLERGGNRRRSKAVFRGVVVCHSVRKITNMGGHTRDGNRGGLRLRSRDGRLLGFPARQG